MLRNEVEIERTFEKAALAAKKLVNGAERSLDNKFINKETYNLFTTIDECLGAQLEALKLLAGEIKAIRTDT
jgi:hypothetical protein